jgi:hypothetical protein
MFKELKNLKVWDDRNNKSYKNESNVMIYSRPKQTEELVPRNVIGRKLDGKVIYKHNYSYKTEGILTTIKYILPTIIGMAATDYLVTNLYDGIIEKFGINVSFVQILSHIKDYLITSSV